MINSLINGDMILESLVNDSGKKKKERCPLHCICQNPFKWIKVKWAEDLSGGRESQKQWKNKLAKRKGIVQVRVFPKQNSKDRNYKEDW